MDANQWKQIKEIYDRALDLSNEERESFLAEACADDADLRREVESLLAAHEDAGTFLQSPAVEVAASMDGAQLLSRPILKRYDLSPGAMQKALQALEAQSMLRRDYHQRDQ